MEPGSGGMACDGVSVAGDDRQMRPRGAHHL